MEDNQEEIKVLVIARLKTLPEDKSISIGSERDFTKEELIQHVEQEDHIGKKIMEVEMRFLRMLKEGKFYE